MWQQSKESKRKKEKKKICRDREAGRGSEQPGDRRRKKMTK